MLIVTSNAVPDPATLGETDGWAEPHVLVALPGSGWTRAELRATQARATVIEYLQRPAGTIRVMQDVLDAMRQTVRQPAGPILFLDTAPAGDMSIASQAALAAADAHGIHADLDRDGRLSRLLLGEMVATSPLLPQLVQHLVRRGVDDARLVQALRTPFLQAPA